MSTKQRYQPRLRLCTFPLQLANAQLSTQAGKSACAAVTVARARSSMVLHWGTLRNRSHSTHLSVAKHHGRHEKFHQHRAQPQSRRNIVMQGPVKCTSPENITGVHDSTMDFARHSDWEFAAGRLKLQSNAFESSRSHPPIQDSK